MILEGFLHEDADCEKPNYEALLRPQKNILGQTAASAVLIPTQWLASH